MSWLIWWQCLLERGRERETLQEFTPKVSSKVNTLSSSQSTRDYEKREGQCAFVWALCHFMCLGSYFWACVWFCSVLLCHYSPPLAPAMQLGCTVSVPQHQMQQGSVAAVEARRYQYRGHATSHKTALNRDATNFSETPVCMCACCAQMRVCFYCSVFVCFCFCSVCFLVSICVFFVRVFVLFVFFVSVFSLFSLFSFFVFCVFFVFFGHWE